MCTPIFGMRYFEDKNGPDDFTLETITEEDILNGYSVVSVKQSLVRKNNEYKYSVKKLSGVEEIFKGSFKDEDVAITLDNSDHHLAIDYDGVNVYDQYENFYGHYPTEEEAIAALDRVKKEGGC